MFEKSSANLLLFLFLFVLIASGYFAAGYSTDASYDENCSPLYEIRMTQFVEEMGIYSNGTSEANHEFSSIDTQKLTVQNQDACDGSKGCQLAKKLYVMDSDDPGEQTIADTCPNTCSGNTCADTCSHTCSGVTCSDACLATRDAATCSETCPDTCMMDNCSHTCPNTCGGVTCLATCPDT
ncbi:MAG: hypothetical protein PHF94_01865, partial [Methanothrix sp.]|nr:hypothetical protein [Methanothrix sp.]